MWLFLVVAAAFSSYGSDKNLLDPLVFDPHFYLNTYGDLVQKYDITDKKGAEKHWITQGIHEDRYGNSFFLAKTYLKMNPEVRSICKANYSCAIDHWINIGSTLFPPLPSLEVGENGLYTLWNVGRTVHYSVYTPRFGSAVHSIMYKNREIVNAWDHGRGIQYSITMNGHGKCYNPTEAGGKYDDHDPTTHSVLKSIIVNDTCKCWEAYMETFEQPAFWLAPGDTDPSCGKAINSEYVSTEWTISKNIQAEIYVNRWPPEILERVSRWWYKVTAPQNVSTFEIEMPKMHTNGDLNKIYKFDVNYHNLTDLSDEKSGSTPSWQPIIIATEDGSLACSGYVTVGSYTFENHNDVQPWAATYNKWSVINKWDDVRKGDDLELISYVVVGTLKEVTDDLIILGGLL